MLGFHPISAAPISGHTEKVINAIEASSEIPPDAKEAFRNFVKDTFQDLWNTIDELIELTPPDSLLDYWELIINILQHLF